MKFKFVLLLLISGNLSISVQAEVPNYAVVVSESTNADSKWHEVVEALREKHHASVITFSKSVTEALPKLREQFPHYACFVATPAEASAQFVVQVHRMTRHLDDDPYTDCIWGILTGYDAANALRIARQSEPLLVRRGLGGTAITLDKFDEGVWFDEGKRGHMVRKERGGVAKDETAPDDTTGAIAKEFNEGNADFFMTSGHATERDWQIGFSYRNGQFRCENGKLFGLDTQKVRHPIESKNPKVYLPVGNCLMGHIDGPDAMALAFMNSGGVNQLVGYVVPTWYGYGGWGVLDYFVKQPGRFTLAESFYANQQALLNRLALYLPELLDAEIDTKGRMKARPQLNDKARKAGIQEKDAVGLLYDRDFVAFYGDPAWEARLAPADSGWEQTLVEKDGVFTFEVKPKAGSDGLAHMDRPLFQFLPQRLKHIELIEGADLEPTVTSKFILLPKGKSSDGKTLRVVFRAEKA